MTQTLCEDGQEQLCVCVHVWNGLNRSIHTATHGQATLSQNQVIHLVHYIC